MCRALLQGSVNSVWAYTNALDAKKRRTAGTKAGTGMPAEADIWPTKFCLPKLSPPSASCSVRKFPTEPSCSTEHSRQDTMTSAAVNPLYQPSLR